MTEHDQAEVERVARSLTKAQRTLYTVSWSLPANPLYGDRLHRYPANCARNMLSSVSAIWRRGMVEPRDPEEGRGPDAWESGGMGFMRLTPLGLAVRAHLLREQQGGQG